MIKKIISIISIVIFAKLNFIYSQITPVSPKNINVPLPVSANSYEISKVSNTPVDLYRGKANISIPIYNISVDDINFPISLSYNTGGIKLNEMAGSVGLGWSLNIPANIFKSVKGLDDEFFPLVYDDFLLAQNLSNLKIYNVSGFTPESTLENIDLAEGILDGRYDSQPDIYNYSTANSNGSFILKGSEGITVPYNQDRIKKIDDSNYMITDNQGVTYYYKNFSNVLIFSPNGHSNTSKDSFYIIKIVTRNNQEINFEYNKSYSYTQENIVESDYFKTFIPFSNTSALPQVEVPVYKKETIQNTHFDKLITKITFPNGELVFNYEPDNYKRKDNNSNNQLKDIQVISKNGKILKKIGLNYSYFISNYENDIPEKYRLRLDNVFNYFDNNYYTFEYEEPNSFPIRGSSSDDHWGYINSLSNEKNINIPDFIQSDELSSGNSLPEYVLVDINSSKTYNYLKGRNKESNVLSKIGNLKSITFPTGAKRKFTYENNEISFLKEKIDYFEDDLLIFENKFIEGSFNENQEVTVNLPPETNSIYDSDNLKFKLTFGNNCQNNNQYDIETVSETSCIGYAVYGSSIISPHFFTEKTLPKTPGLPIKLKLSRYGDCNCAFSVSYSYEKKSFTNENHLVGGLRVKEIQDFNENENLLSTIKYKYEKLDSVSNRKVSSGILEMPLQYVKKINFNLDFLSSNPNIVNPPIAPYFYYEISNNGNLKNYFGADNVVGYTNVIEYQENNGFSESIFSNLNSTSSIFTNFNADYDKWKNGLLLKQNIFNKDSILVKSLDKVYNFDTRKNNLFGFKNLSFNNELAFFSTNFKVDKSIVLNYIDTSNQIFYYEIKPDFNFGYSAHIQNIESTETDYFSTKKINKITKNTYSQDIENTKPINLFKSSTTFPDGTIQETTYQYAHEKNNQYLIDKNMIGIPLQTTVTKNNLGISSIETKYPTTQTEANTKTTGLPLPTSVVSYGVQIPGMSSTSTTEVTYDKYDNKGNILQYTLKGLQATVIIWGYNQTQPIVKIEGIGYDSLMALSGVSTLVNDAITKSNSDVDGATEQLLLTALDNLRTNSSLNAYMISTYTYNPLIGVTSITPPSGVREIYKYDSANRLQSVVDVNGKILKEYQYNYKQ